MRFSKSQSHFAGYMHRVVLSSIGNITLYDPQNKWLFYVVNRYFVVAEIGYRADENCAVQVV